MRASQLIQRFFYASLLFFVSMFCFSSAAFANLISIAAVSPFPTTVNVGSTTTATYSVTNVSSKVPVTVIDQSKFPVGLSIQSTTCGSLMQPGASCQITLQLQAASKPRMITTYLKEWAKPSAEGVKFPIIVSVIIPKRFTVTPSAGPNGTISPNTPQSVVSGDSVSFTATPLPNFHVDQWLVDGTLAQIGGTTFTLNDVTANHTIAVSFAQTTFTITSSAGSNGTVSPDGEQTVNSGSNITFTATPSGNFHVNQWIVDGSVAQTGGMTFEFMNVTANHTIAVSFAQTTFTITSSAGSNGTVSPDGEQTVNSGSNIIFTATPSENFHVTQWIVDGSVAQTGGMTFEFMNVTANHTVSVSFDDTTFTITSSAGANGTVSPDGAQTVNSGSNITFTAMPSGNFHVNQWIVDDSVAQTGGTTFEFMNVTANHTVVVSFSNTWNVEPLAGANGSISPNTTQTVVNGNDIAFTATPSIGFTVNQWLVDGVVLQTGETGFTLTNVTADHTVQVTFQAITGLLTAVGSTDQGLILASTNGGASWSQQTVSGSPVATSSTYNASSCVGSGASAICTAVGRYATSVPDTSFPLLAVTTNGSSSWTNISLSGSGDLSDTSCTGSGVTAVCAAVGRTSDPITATPLIFVSTNGANTWTNKTITNNPTVGVYNGVSCTGTGATAICVAVGEDSTLSGPLLAKSTDGGNTWAVQTIAGIPANTEFSTVSCTGATTTAICAAGGSDVSNNVPVLIVSTDGGANWSQPSVTLPAGAAVTGTSCVGTGSTAICVAVGFNASNNPLLVVSTNGGVTWNTATITNGATGILASVSCTGTGSTAVCATSGELVAVSTDGGSSWAKVSTGVPTNSEFSSVSCTGTTSTAKCAAAGTDFTSNGLVLVDTLDGGATWTTVTTNVPTGPGSFNGTGATGG